MRRIAALASTAIVLTLVLGACGGDDSGGALGASAGSGNFCGFAKDLEKNQDELFSDSEDPADLKASLAKVNDVFEEAAAKAPSEIKDDFKTLQTSFKQLSDFYSKIGDDPKAFAEQMTKDPEAAEKAMSALSDPEFEAASTRIRTYMAKECDIDTGSDPTDTAN